MAWRASAMGSLSPIFATSSIDLRVRRSSFWSFLVFPRPYRWSLTPFFV